MFYDTGFTCYRCKKAKIINKKLQRDGISKQPMDINIDGEDLVFTDFAKYFAKYALPARREKFPKILPARC